MPQQQPVQQNGHQILLVAVFDDETRAQQALQRLQDKDAPMDMLSILGKVHPSGDDVLGISYHGPGERLKTWARQGAFWGGVWGMLSGAAMFVLLPGVGPLIAAGSIVETLAGVLAAEAAGTVVGGAIGAGAMAGAAAATRLMVVLHRSGIPPEQLEHLHSAIEAGHYVLLLRTTKDTAGQWQSLLQDSQPTELLTLPWHGLESVL